MDHVTKLLRDAEGSRIDRRQLFQALGVTATAAFAGFALPKSAKAVVARVAQGAGGANRTFPATTVNHLSITSADYVRSRDFYVDLLGMRVTWDDTKKCQVDFGSVTAPNSLYLVQGTPGNKPAVGHIALGLPNFWAQRDALKAEFERRGMKVQPDGEAGFSIDAPSGYRIQPVPVKDVAMFPGAAQPCEVAKSEKCQAAYKVGLEGLGTLPKPSGKGFRAAYFKAIVVNVPDVAQERDFYTSVFGMKIVSDKTDECSLRFGQNTLVLRPAGSDGKPSCNQVAFVIETYDQAKVKAELARRGLDPTPGSRGGWRISDPDGLSIEITGRD